MFKIWFWQGIISPHMAGLAVALARRGCKVTYVAQRAMSDDRARQGWPVPLLPSVVLELAECNEMVQGLVQLAPPDSIHICQGVRANGLVGLAQSALAKRGLCQWVVMETVDDSGWRGVLKRLEYSRIFRARRTSLQGVLATGHRTTDWVVARGLTAGKAHPFAYFLPEHKAPVAQAQRKPGPFRFLFAGQLIPRKRVDWLVNALANLKDSAFELWVVGTGPEEPELRALAASKLGNRVHWLGQLLMPDVPKVMEQVDCLVLPSLHDGWGAVASEALMAGTPVICSDACGVAGVVQASGQGGVFPVNDRSALIQLLVELLVAGPVPAQGRRLLMAWANDALGSAAGAAYLEELLTHDVAGNVIPVAPWLKLKEMVHG